MVGAAKRSWWRATARFAPVLGLALTAAFLPRPAAAQFSWFGQSGASPQDAYDTIAEHGFRLVAPMMQNRDVYIADVIDRRQRRERLILSRDNGQIVQRFLIDTGRGPYASLPGAPYGGPLPQRQPEGGVFDRIVRGFNDDAAPRPPAGIGDPDRPDAVAPQVLPKPQRMTRPRPADIEPRLATPHEEAPIATRPLAPEPAPSAPAAQPAATAAPANRPAAPAQTATPQPGAPPSQPTAPASAPPPRATVVTSDPLRIPGTKDADTPKPATTAVAVKPAAPPKPPAAKAPAGDVPVAPLD